MTRPMDETVAELVELLDEDLQEMFEERAAVREHDGGIVRAHAEALALLDVVARYPEALAGVIAFAVEYDGVAHWVVTTDEDLARERIARKKGSERARRSVARVVGQAFGGLAEIVAAT